MIVSVLENLLRYDTDREQDTCIGAAVIVTFGSKP